MTNDADETKPPEEEAVLGLDLADFAGLVQWLALTVANGGISAMVATVVQRYSSRYGPDKLPTLRDQVIATIMAMPKDKVQHPDHLRARVTELFDRAMSED